MNETAQEEAEEGLSLQEFTKFLTECEEQPAWRSRADREHDYYDGNQLDRMLCAELQSADFLRQLNR